MKRQTNANQRQCTPQLFSMPNQGEGEGEGQGGQGFGFGFGFGFGSALGRRGFTVPPRNSLLCPCITCVTCCRVFVCFSFPLLHLCLVLLHFPKTTAYFRREG